MLKKMASQEDFILINAKNRLKSNFEKIAYLTSAVQFCVAGDNKQDIMQLCITPLVVALYEHIIHSYNTIQFI